MKPLAFWFLDARQARPHKCAVPALRFHPPARDWHDGPVVPLYPKSVWQALNAEEKDQLGAAYMASGQSAQDFIVAIELALKEKNARVIE